MKSACDAVSDGFDDVTEMDGPMKNGIMLPMSMGSGGGGMSLINCTFVNFKNPCIVGCAHCGLGGSPSIGDGGFESRFSQVSSLKYVLECVCVCVCSQTSPCVR